MNTNKRSKLKERKKNEKNGLYTEKKEMEKGLKRRKNCWFRTKLAALQEEQKLKVANWFVENSKPS